MKQYEIPFKTHDGRLATVSVYSDSWSTMPIDLQGAGEPFTTSLDDSDDLFTPVRRSTGYLRIVDDGTLSGIIPTGAKEKRVTLDIDGTLMWQGWLKAESYKSAWDYLPTLEIPIQSGLGVLEQCPLPQEDITLRTGATLSVTYGSVRVSRLILECVHLMGTTVNTIVFPATITSTDGWGALGYRLSRWNYFERNTDTNYDDEDWKPLEAKTALEVLTDICTFFGWTCEEWHDVLYFVEVGATDYAAVTYEQLISYATEASTPEVSSVILPLPLSLSSDYKLAGSRNTIEHMQPARKVTMSVSSSEVSEIVSIRENDLALLNYYVNPSLSNVIKSFYSKNPLLELYYYVYDGTWHKTDVDEDHGPVPVGPGHGLASVGAIPCCYDRFATMAVGEEKKNWDLNTLGVYFRKKAYYQNNYYSPTAEQALNMPAIIITSPGVACFSAGYLCISATAKSAGLGRSIADVTQNGRGDVKAQLRIGGKYWNGSAWTTTVSYFDIHLGLDDADNHETTGDGKVIDTKTRAMDCESCNGQMIPITENMTGDIVLTFPCLVQTVGSYGSGDYDELGLVDFRIEYKAPISNYYEDSDTRHYTAFTGSDGEVVEVKASIASDQNTRPGYGLLMTASNVPVKTVTYTNSEQTRPELRLINRMAAHYTSVRDKITVDVDPYQAEGAVPPNTDNPLTLVGYGSKTFAIIGRSVNWREWTQTLTLLEI